MHIEIHSQGRKQQALYSLHHMEADDYDRICRALHESLDRATQDLFEELNAMRLAR